MAKQLYEAQKQYNKRNRARITAWHRNNRAKRKKRAVEHLGGKCMSCGGAFHPAVFDFHHRDPTQKDYTPAHILGHSWEKLLNEIEKCDLLCANCHRLVHHSMDYIKE